MPLIPRKKSNELRRDRDNLRKALSRFLVVVAPVTSIQLFTGPDSKPLDTRHHGVPLYGSRALDRLRKQNIITLQRRYYSLVPEGRDRLEAILADDKLLDQLHLSEKYLPKGPKEKIDPEQVARELEDLAGLSNEPEPEPVESIEPTTQPSEAEEPPQEGQEVSFVQYVVGRFDMLQEQISDLSATLPEDTKAHLETIGEGLHAVRGDFETLSEMYLKTATSIEQVLSLVKEDHEFLMTLRESLKPRTAEKTNHVQPV